jgi:neutral/alkaline ceramidase-like enzyme
MWILVLCFAGILGAADYKAGAASVVITPSQPIYLSGYANRSHASEGVIQDLKAKALVIEDKRGARVAIVTTDLIGLPRAVTDIVAARLQKSYGLERSRLLVNSSHTHTGPLIAHNLQTMFDLSPDQAQVVQDYTRKLTDDLVTLVGAAIQNLAPADLSFGNGQAHFGTNRREPTPKGIKNGVNRSGPTDPDVPVLKVTSPEGQLRVVLFGYACHNTTLTGEFYKFSGDYAGFAQRNIEQATPGVTAMFLELCGADQNPIPRSTLALAEQYGKQLSEEVMRVSAARLEPVHGPIRPVFQIVDLDFASHSRSTFESRLDEKNPWRVRHAKAMLKTYDEGRPIRRYPYPVQVIQFGKDLTVLALGGEVVVDYCLRVKKEYGSKGILVAGYSNDVMSYIPSLRVLKEGGYEADDSMIYYGLPGPYAEDVEERIFRTIRMEMKRVGRKPVQ